MRNKSEVFKTIAYTASCLALQGRNRLLTGPELSRLTESVLTGARTELSKEQLQQLFLEAYKAAARDLELTPPWE